MGDSPENNASLTDFLGTSGDSAGEDDAEQTTQSDPDPPTDTGSTTARVAPAGNPCENCETRATRLWHTDDGLLCGDCRNWE